MKFFLRMKYWRIALKTANSPKYFPHQNFRPYVTLVRIHHHPQRCDTVSDTAEPLYTVKNSLNKRPFSNDTVCSPNQIELCKIYLKMRDTSLYRTASWVPMVSSIVRFHCIQDSQLGPNGVLYREVPLYTGQPAGSQ